MNPLDSIEPSIIPNSIQINCSSSSSSSNSTSTSTSQGSIIMQSGTDNKQPIQPRRTSYKRANSVSFDDRDKFRSRLNSTFNNLFKGVYQETNDAIFKRNRKPSSQLPVAPTKYTSPFDPLSSYFDNHNTLKNFNDIKLISTDELIQFLIKHYTTELPEVDKMFPWLHGVHKNNFAQIRFLSSLSFDTNDNGNSLNNDLDNYDDENTIEIPSSTRSIMVIRSSNIDGDVPASYENIIAESTGLIKGTVSSSDVLVSISNVRNIALYLQSVLTPGIFKIYPLDSIIKDCFNVKLLPIFKDMDPQLGVSLRNFHIQVSKLSHISDLIVYCFNDDHLSCVNVSTDNELLTHNCKCSSLSRLLHIAQLLLQEAKPIIQSQCLNSYSNSNKYYNTFILQDGLQNIKLLDSANLLSIPIMSQESASKKNGELCSMYDLKVFNNWDSNCLYREKLEISKMSSATPIAGGKNENIWFGNTTDFECLHIHLNQLQEDGSNEIELASFVNNYKINKNAPLHCDPSNTIVNITKKDLESQSIKEIDVKLITFPKSNWKLFIHCVDGARFPILSSLSSVFETINDLSTIYLEFPPSGSVTLSDLSDDDILSIINICKLIYYKCSSEFSGLLYCSDGYTETSLLALCYLIYSEGLKLDDALIKLHVDYGRPFFIFKSDYVLLQRLEPIIHRFSPAFHDNDIIGINNNELILEDNKFIIKSILLSPKPLVAGPSNSVAASVGNSISTTATNLHVVELRGPQKSRVGLSAGIETNLQSNEGSYDLDREKMFQSVMGSLPSRILPHLYLGSLSHANSLPLLKELGINYVVSVGEAISWMDGLHYDSLKTESGCQVLKILPNQTNANGTKCFVNEVMKISNINDDGIGTLTTTINDALSFIDKCYSNGGKVLVHCQVGVSRSATVCIAEVMKRLNISLPRAYLFVRVRRLNVIIQPNLKLMYELFKWEEVFVKEKLSIAVATANIARNGSLSSSLSSSNGSNSIFSNAVGERSSGRSSISTSISSLSSNFMVSSNREGSISNNIPTSVNNSNKPRLSAVSFEKSITEDPNENDVFVDSNSEDEDEEVVVAAAVTGTVAEEEEEDDDDDLTSSNLLRTETKFKNISFDPQSGMLKNCNNANAVASASINPKGKSSLGLTSFPLIMPTSILNTTQNPNSVNINTETNFSPKNSIDHTALNINNDKISTNCSGFIREVDWFIFCREIFNLNRAYIKPNS